MRTIILILIAAATVFPVASHGQGASDPETGHDLLAACQAFIDGPESSSSSSLQDKLDWLSKSEFCYGYIRGVVEWNGSYEQWLEKVLFKPIFCLGDNQVEIDQLVEIAITYMNDHPEELPNKAAAVLGSAFSAAFPCSALK